MNMYRKFTEYFIDVVNDFLFGSWSNEVYFQCVGGGESGGIVYASSSPSSFDGVFPPKNEDTNHSCGLF